MRGATSAAASATAAPSKAKTARYTRVTSMPASWASFGSSATMRAVRPSRPRSTTNRSTAKTPMAAATISPSCAVTQAPATSNSTRLNGVSRICGVAPKSSAAAPRSTWPKPSVTIMMETRFCSSVRRSITVCTSSPSRRPAPTATRIATG